MKIAVRLDDITPDMDWEKFNQFKALLDDYGIRPLLGIVPDNRDLHLHKSEPDAGFWEKMKELKREGWILAMHGYHHLYGTNCGGIFPLNHFSEFAGRPYEKQLAMIKAGKKILEQNGIETDIFMAPAHSYDGNTLKALRVCGFEKITDGFGKMPYRYKWLTFYPISFHLKTSLSQKEGYSTMVVHVNEISASGMKTYQKRFEEYRDNFISYGEYLTRPAVNRGFWGMRKERLLAGIKHILVKVIS